MARLMSNVPLFMYFNEVHEVYGRHRSFGVKVCLHRLTHQRIDAY